MADDSFQEKTEAPTPKKRSKARSEGQVAVSKEAGAVFILFFALGVFYFAGVKMLLELDIFIRFMLENLAPDELNIERLTNLLLHTIKQILSILIPLFVAVIIAAIVGNIAQFGFLFTFKPLAPKMSKLNPISGMKKFVSLKSLVEVVKSILKVGIIGGVSYVMVKKEIPAFPALIHMGVIDILAYIGITSFKICIYTCLVLIILAALDYAYQKWEFEKKLKMSKQEIKEETKQTQGDPLVKSRIRKAQMEMALRRMMQDVPKADVVITNPTHLAIALKYDIKIMAAPKVVAKGAGIVAERIREIAMENNVPIVEEKPLAQVLYKAVEIGESIPADLYKAVAEVLAYVYRLKGKKKL